jgi:hypothetical protein
MDNNELADTLEKLAKHLRENNSPLPADDARKIHENIWKLYDTTPPQRPMCDACRRGGVCGCYQPLWDSPTCIATPTRGAEK